MEDNNGLSDQDSAAQETSTTKESDINSQRAFTIKSLGFGLAALLIIILITDYNDFVLGQASLIANHLPPGPIFLILATALFWNPMWYRRWAILAVGLPVSTLAICFNVFALEQSFLLGAHWLIPALFLLAFVKPVWDSIAPRLRMSSKEMIVSLCIVLSGCWTAGAGLNNFYSYVQVVPWKLYSNDLHMQKYESIEYVPAHLWPGGGLTEIGDDTDKKQRVYDAFYTGYAQQETDGIPWDAWLPQLFSSWLPMLAFLSAALIAMALLVHRQWSRHEQLAYPLAQIGTTLFDKKKERALPDIFYEKSFWIAALCVIGFHSINLLNKYWPSSYPSIPTSATFGFVFDMFPTLNKSGGFGLNSFGFYFTIIGVCYFLPREIGLSLGLSQIVLAIVGAQFYLSTGDRIGGEDVSNMRAGAYLAYAAVILYTGRHYYWTILRKALSFKQSDEDHQEGIFAARVLLVSFIGLIATLSLMFGMDIFMAIMFSLLTMLLFLVFARVICETGVPYMQAGWQPATVLTKFFGPSAVGAAPIVMMYYLGAILFSDPKEAMLPYVSNSFKMADNYKIKLKRVCVLILGLVTVAIVVSVCARVYQHYSDGAYNSKNAYGQLHVPRNFLRESTLHLSQLDDIGQRPAPAEAHDNIPGIFERLSLISPDSDMLSFMFAGGIAVIAFFALRFRFTGFPLHPVIFLVWGTYPSQRTFYVFLVGWFLRELIVRFGGGRVYQSGKPFFIGLIFAELAMGLLGSSVGWLYYSFTGFGDLPPGYRVIPG